MYAVFPYISTRGCFQDSTHDLMVTRQQLYHSPQGSLSKKNADGREKKVKGSMFNLSVAYFR
jgi:hypothetical protein